MDLKYERDSMRGVVNRNMHKMLNFNLHTEEQGAILSVDEPSYVH